MSVKFFSRCIRPSTIANPFGNGERSIFEERVENGQRRLVVTGKEDFKSFIEASKEETLIKNIIKRFENGDVTAISKTQGFYGDVTGMPSNLAEAQNFLINLQNNFDSLPGDIKEKFGNSFDNYVKEVSNMDIDTFNKHFVLQDKVNKDESLLVDDKKDGDNNE